MTLTVHPDPRVPGGGHGYFQLPEKALPDDVHVAIQDAFSERWLSASPDPDHAWQGDRHDFGPIRVQRHRGADWVRIGPEIVDRIEEYANLNIWIGGAVHSLIWPDTVSPRAAAAAVGGVRPVRRPVAAPEVPDPKPQAATEETLPLGDELDTVVPAAPVAGRAAGRRAVPLWPFLVLLVLGAGAAAWYLSADAPSLTPAPEIQPVAGPGECGFNQLQALQDFGARMAAIRECGGAVPPDTALRVIEDAALAGDGAALLLFGTIYDDDQVDEVIEARIGLSFADDPARAVEYYARAAEAGSAEAEARVAAVCARLEGSGLTLEKGAYDDYCR